MNMTPEQLTERYAACPSEKNAYETDGKRYVVTRCFTGNKKLKKLIEELAVSQANREFGLS